MANTGEKNDPLMVRAVEKAFRVLSTFDESRPRQTLTQLAESAGLDRSAAQRFSHTLWKLGYLHKDQRNKTFELTPKALSLAYQYTRSSPIVLRAHPYLSHLNKATEETISLTVLDGTEVIYLSRYLSPNVLDTDVMIGSRLPAYCSAGGLAILSTMPDAEVDALLDASDLRAFTRRTIFDREGIKAAVETARTRGFAMVEEQIYAGDITIAVALRLPGSDRVAAVSLGASLFRYDAQQIVSRFAPMLMGATRSMSQGVPV
ncbi:helix-turn-helix domain-containing protein [Salipiger sp. P9]|uniref:IclR family transcriptional regulator n=1 Tax=Salipiger pentaromativorans TaxID=2943193 RepID=UPI002157AE1E|nr:IclR family transcriptional regulator C-terminal domain-containing protein [Salipiger pentaromativorans]MCR8550522.1 helix-turn-helix domain-containing protein [Salipiger pentaromativorans]